MTTKTIAKFKSSVLTFVLTIVTLAVGQSAWAQVTYNATAGTAGAPNEGSAELFDGKTSTKWCVTSLGNPTYVEFNTSEAVTPKGYMLTTGNDTKENPGRNPKTWVLKAKVNSNDNEWTPLHTVENDTRMSTENCTGTAFVFTNTTAYQYFRLEISAIQSDNIFQLSEFRFLSDDEVTTLLTDFSQVALEGLQAEYHYTGSAISIGYTVKDLKGETIDPSNYTATIKNRSNEVVTEVVDNDTYTLTITPNGNTYQGEKTVTFTVVPWSAAAIAGGYCGNPNENDGRNVYYEITEDAQSNRTLTIKGSGAMADYNSYWYKYKGSIKYVVVDDGVTSIGHGAFYDHGALLNATVSKDVTSIGNRAFSNCEKLTTVTLNEGSQLATIGESAFYYCKVLESINIPNSVTSIGDYGFYCCYQLTSNTIPNSLTSIGKSAFYNCDNVTSVDIGSGLTSIGLGAFYHCDALSFITVDENNTAFKAINNVLFSSDEKTLLIYPNGLKATAYTIPEGVTTIGDYAFSRCSDLATITIPASVTTIGDYAFEGTAWINNQSYENGVLYINNVVVASQYNVVSGALNIKSGTTAIAGGALDGCAMTSVFIPASVTSIGDQAFLNCNNLKNVTFEVESQLTTIGGEAFARCYSLTSIDIPAGVTSIGDDAFQDCKKLTDITIPANVTSIGKQAFYYCQSLASITIPEGVTTIGDHAFFGCEKLASITIPASVTSIGDYAFAYCSNLTAVTFNKGSQLATIGDNAFYNCGKLTSFTIPASVTSIGYEAFNSCYYIRDVYCYADPTQLTWDDGGCNDFMVMTSHSTVCHVENAADWSSFVSKVNVTFAGGYCGTPTANDGKNLRWDVALDNGSQGYKMLRIFKNPDAVGDDFSMADGVNFGDADYRKATIENGVTSIGANAFNGLSKLKSVIVLAETPPTLGSNAFKGIDNNAKFTVRNETYQTATGWEDITNHTGDYSYEGCAFTMNVPIDGGFDIAYLDANGQTSVCPFAFPITSSNDNVEFSNSGNTWYYVSGKVGITGELHFTSDYESTNLILCDGAILTANHIWADNLNIYVQSNGNNVGTMNVTTPNNNPNNNNWQECIYANNSLTINGGKMTFPNAQIGIYGNQGDITINGGTITIENANNGIYGNQGYITINGGTITINDAWDNGIVANKEDIAINGGTITIENANNKGIYTDQGDIAINGGTITINDASTGIHAHSNTVGKGGYITINGGKVSAKGIMVADDITLGYGRFDDSIYANSYNGHVSVKTNQILLNDSTDSYRGTLNSSEIAGKTLTPDVWGIADGNDGSESKPYIISNTAGLDYLAAQVNAGIKYGNDDKHPDGYFFRLAKDITYPHTTDWDDATSTENNYTPIGCYVNSSLCSFSSTFDGKGHTVRGIRIYRGGNDNNNDCNLGLFGCTQPTYYAPCTCTVKNVIVADMRITGYQSVGGIVGHQDGGSVTNCHATSTVALHALHDDSGDFGGIVGTASKNLDNGIISGCTSSATLTVSGTHTTSYNFGGIVGCTDVDVKNCLAVGVTIPDIHCKDEYNDFDASGAIAGYYDYSAGYANNYYSGCTLGNTQTDSGIGMGYSSIFKNRHDVISNDGAVAAIASATKPESIGEEIGSYTKGLTVYKNGAFYQNTYYLQTVTIAANAHDGSYWTTYYNGTTGAEITSDENACAYTAEYSVVENQPTLTLHALGKVIPAGTAVIVVGKVNSISMKASTETVSEMPNNNLRGLDVRTQVDDLQYSSEYHEYNGCTFYVMSKKGDKFGFFKYELDADGNNYLYMPANKAFLPLHSSTNAPTRMVFDDMTGIRPVLDSGLTVHDSGWYTISGLKLNGMPTQKGVYINGGIKVVIK